MHERRVSAALLASCVMHAGMIAITFLSMRAALERGSTATASADERHPSLIWLLQPAPAERSRGGGGGGNRMAAPPQRVERRGDDARTVPAGPTPTIEPSRRVQPEVEPTPRVDIPVVPLASGAQMVPGAIDAPQAPQTPSLGPGSGNGVTFSCMSLLAHP